MNTPRTFSPRNPWFVSSLLLTLVIAVTSALFGFVLLPQMQANARYTGIWDAICSAAGLVRAAPASDPVMQTSYPTTQVMVTQQMLAHAGAEAIGRGATLALRCTNCHGARGLSQAESPNLAGQYSAVIYKQLRDYKSGARVSAVMTPLVADLADTDMRELAAYYAYLPRLPPYHPASAGPAPVIVVGGAPMRSIAPCGSCHGAMDNKAGAAWLDGQPASYIKAQLRAFATDARRNDISEQMRNVARNMTAADIDASARYYANRP